MTEQPELLTEIVPDKVVEVPQPELLMEVVPKRKYKTTTIDENSVCSSCSC